MTGFNPLKLRCSVACFSIFCRYFLAEYFAEITYYMTPLLARPHCTRPSTYIHTLYSAQAPRERLNRYLHSFILWNSFFLSVFTPFLWLRFFQKWSVDTSKLSWTSLWVICACPFVRAGRSGLFFQFYCLAFELPPLKWEKRPKKSTVWYLSHLELVDLLTTITQVMGHALKINNLQFSSFILFKYYWSNALVDINDFEQVPFRTFKNQESYSVLLLAILMLASPVECFSALSTFCSPSPTTFHLIRAKGPPW